MTTRDMFCTFAQIRENDLDCRTNDCRCYAIATRRVCYTVCAVRSCGDHGQEKSLRRRSVTSSGASFLRGKACNSGKVSRSSIAALGT
jgi:hypothetical protein